MGKHRSLREIAATLCNLLFPPRCVGCRDLLRPSDGTDTVFCPYCRTKWEAAMAEAAPQAVRDAERGVIYLTFYRPHRPDGVPERVIYHLKHKGDPRTFAFVASRLAPRVLRAADALPTRAPASEMDREEPSPLLFTYPPRRRSAVREYGFDQASRLARALAKACGGEYATLIRRVRRPAPAQKTLDERHRMQNAAHAYLLNPRRARIVRGRTVVVCDDLRASGATLGRCAELLTEAGAGLVLLVTVERTHIHEKTM